MLEFWNFVNSHELSWNFAQMTKSVFVVEKTYFALPRTNLSAFSVSLRFHLSKAFSVVSLFIWKVIILHSSHLKLSTHRRKLTFGEKTRFSPLMIYLREVPRIHLCFWHFTNFFSVLEFWKFQNSHELSSNLTQMNESFFVVEKT